jgi:glycerol-3-phosphate acyltransferase PlsY
MEWVGGIALVVGAFAVGGVPWGLVLGHFFSGLDIRRYGSGSIGTTNALRVLGWRISASVFVLDFLKGLLPVLIGRWAGASDWVVALAGIAAVAGHCWSPYLGFRGGKGVATSGGAAIGLFPWVLLLLPFMAGIVALTRYVSLGSIATSGAAALLALAVAATGHLSWAFVVAIAGMSAIIVYKHQTNIQRLLSGSERRIGESATPTQPAG